MISKFINTDDKRRLAGNFFSLIVLRGFQFLIPLITLPYLVRTIGLDNFGLVNFALSLALYFGAVIQFGFGVTATREIARNRDDKVKLNKIYSVTLTASFLLALISAITFGLIVMVFDKFNHYLYLYLFTILFVIFQSLFPIWFFQGMEKMKYITFLSLGTSTMFLISLFAFVKQADDFVLVPLLNAISAFITLIIALVLVKKQFKVEFIVPKLSHIKAVYKDGRHAFISQLAPNLYNNSAVFLLGLFTSNSVVGLYTAATKVVDAVISFAYIISNTFLPYLSRNLQKHKVLEKIMLIVGTVFTFIIFIMADNITSLLFSSNNLEIASYVKWLSVCILFIFITITYGTNFLMLIGKDYVVKNIGLYTSLFFFVIALFIIPLLGIYGAIITLVGARFVMMLTTTYFYFKYRTGS